MHWPVSMDWNSKVIKDICSCSSPNYYGSNWFEALHNEGYMEAPPTLSQNIGYWWKWGN